MGDFVDDAERIAVGLLVGEIEGRAVGRLVGDADGDSLVHAVDVQHSHASKPHPECFATPASSSSFVQRRPPQSWQTTVRSRKSSCRVKETRLAIWLSRLCACSLTGCAVISFVSLRDWAGVARGFALGAGLLFV